MSKIKILVMDVDGTLTDGKIYMGSDGEAVKAFSIKDGCGITKILPQYGIIPAIITARESRILENRCRELGIHEFHQGEADKLVKLREIAVKYHVGLDAVAYAGDDLPDIPCIEEVKEAGGLVVCPADAIPEIRAMADYVSKLKAGDGAIRDCIHYLIQADRSTELEERINRAVRYILEGDFAGKTAGYLPDGSHFTIQEYMTKEEADCVLESHREHVDIQYILEGREVFKTYSVNCLTNAGAYDRETDTDHWGDGFEISNQILVPGSLICVRSGQPHKGATMVEQPEYVRKLVCKITV